MPDPMTLNETHIPALDKGEVAYKALQFIETYFNDHQHKLADGFEDGIHEAPWEALSYVEVVPT